MMKTADHRMKSARVAGAAAVDFLIARPEELTQMLTEIGADLAGAAAFLEQDEGLAAALDFLSRDEARAEAFCTEAALTPEAFAAARGALSGETPHWT